MLVWAKIDTSANPCSKMQWHLSKNSSRALSPLRWRIDHLWYLFTWRRVKNIILQICITLTILAYYMWYVESNALHGIKWGKKWKDFIKVNISLWIALAFANAAPRISRFINAPASVCLCLRREVGFIPIYQESVLPFLVLHALFQLIAAPPGIAVEGDQVVISNWIQMTRLSH